MRTDTSRGELPIQRVSIVFHIIPSIRAFYQNPVSTHLRIQVRLISKQSLHGKSSVNIHLHRPHDPWLLRSDGQDWASRRRRLVPRRHDPRLTPFLRRRHREHAIIPLEALPGVRNLLIPQLIRSKCSMCLRVWLDHLGAVVSIGQGDDINIATRAACDAAAGLGVPRPAGLVVVGGFVPGIALPGCPAPGVAEEEGHVMAEERANDGKAAAADGEADLDDATGQREYSHHIG